MALGTMTSRVTGFLRTAVLVAALGTGAVGDTYNTANTVPFIVYDLLLGGVLTAVHIPLIIKAKQRDARYGEEFEQRLFTLAVMTLAVITAVAVLLGPVFIDIYGPDFHGSQRELAVTFARIFALQILFLGVSAFAGAILNTRKRFGAPMWAPVINNLVICGIGVLFLLVARGKVTPDSITNGEISLLAVGTVGGIVLQTVALWPALRSSGFRWRPRFDFRRAELSEISRMAVWTLMYVIITQIGFAVTTSLANSAGVRGRIEGVGNVGYTPYFNAYQLFQLPYAIIGVSVITALLPRMSRHAAEGRSHLVRDDFSSGIRLSSTLIVPAAVLMLILGPEITMVLFAHGNTGSADTAVIANVMRIFALALIPYAVYQLMLRVFYSMGDTRTPALICLVAVGVNICSALLVYRVLPTDKVVVGIAGGFGLGQAAGAVVSWLVLRRRLDGMGGRGIVTSYVRLLLAALPMAVYAFCVHYCFDRLTGAGLLPSLAVLVIGTAGGGFIYLMAAQFLRAGEVQAILHTVGSRLRPSRRPAA
jgi:putative peptidoglycan lipid II flippase